MPINALPSKAGTVAVTWRKAENKLLAERFSPTEHKGRKLYVCHFDTCPELLAKQSQPPTRKRE